ncbi:hypothetical protein EDB86DRAFT_2834824 [Lactarius hatsudake]|nr:hypothetical protein EDB86DRAFT_2834824 [Lactarius hatsudake]
MTYFDASFGIANLRTFSAPLGAPASVEDGSTTQSSIVRKGIPFTKVARFPTTPPVLNPKAVLIPTTVASMDMSASSSYLGGFTRTPNATTSTSAIAPPLFAEYGPYTHGFDLLSEPLGRDFSTFPTPALTNASSIPSPPTDDIGGHINTPHTHEMLASNFVTLSDLLSDFGTLDTFQAEQVPGTPPYWDGTNFAPLTQRDDAPTSAPVGMFENIPTQSYPDFPRPSSWVNYVDNMAVPTDVLTATTTIGGTGRAGTVLVKRAREWYGISRKPPHMMLMRMTAAAPEQPTRGGQAPVGSWKRQRGPQRGLTRPTPLGPKIRRQNTSITVEQRGSRHNSARTQEMAGFPEQEQLEGREQLETPPDSRGMMPLHSGESAEDREGLYAIPSTLTERQRLMLQTTEDDVERGAVHSIKCKLCPTVELGSWQCFQRHCKTSEDHPAELTFCNRCGDHFGRRDSEKRHTGKRYQEECRTTPRDQAEWKKTTVKRLFEEFNVKIERCLRTGEELGPRFAVITQQAIQQAKVPTTSKKQKKKQSEGDS